MIEDTPEVRSSIPDVRVPRHPKQCRAHVLEHLSLETNGVPVGDTSVASAVAPAVAPPNIEPTLGLRRSTWRNSSARAHENQAKGLWRASMFCRQVLAPKKNSA